MIARMNLLTVTLALGVLGASGAWAGEAQPPATHPESGPAGQVSTPAKIKDLIADLSSDDGNKRAAATKQFFAFGADAIDSLVKAGAQQVTPKPPRAEVRRLDVIYTLLDGMHQNATAGYRTDAFLLRVEKDCTVDDVAKMGERYGFTIRAHNGINDGYCTAFPKQGQDFAGTLKALLSGEPKVVSLQVLYFSGPTP